MRLCRECKEEKPLSSFNVRRYKNGKTGYRHRCKKCHNKYSIRWKQQNPEKVYLWDKDKHLRKYGLNSDLYETMVVQQDGRCGICGLRKEEFKSRLGVDHNHLNGTVRGLLCVRCNTGIGQFKTIVLLEKAAEYLRKYGEENVERRAES